MDSSSPAPATRAAGPSSSGSPDRGRLGLRRLQRQRDQRRLVRGPVAAGAPGRNQVVPTSSRRRASRAARPRRTRGAAPVTARLLVGRVALDRAPPAASRRPRRSPRGSGRSCPGSSTGLSSGASRRRARRPTAAPSSFVRDGRRAAAQGFAGARTAAPGGRGGATALHAGRGPRRVRLPGGVALRPPAGPDARTNLALVNAGRTAAPHAPLRGLRRLSGGRKIGTSPDLVLGPGAWLQVDRVPQQLRPPRGVRRVYGVSGNERFLAYAVVNDGPRPGGPERTTGASSRWRRRSRPASVGRRRTRLPRPARARKKQEWGTSTKSSWSRGASRCAPSCRARCRASKNCGALPEKWSSARPSNGAAEPRRSCHSAFASTASAALTSIADPPISAARATISSPYSGQCAGELRPRSSSDGDGRTGPT